MIPVVPSTGRQARRSHTREGALSDKLANKAMIQLDSRFHGNDSVVLMQ